jgi:hypothetical protein
MECKGLGGVAPVKVLCAVLCCAVIALLDNLDEVWFGCLGTALCFV